MKRTDPLKRRLPDLDRTRRVFLERVVTEPPRTAQPAAKLEPPKGR